MSANTMNRYRTVLPRATYFILRDGGVVDTREFITENPRKMAQKWFDEIQSKVGECLLVVACKGLGS